MTDSNDGILWRTLFGIGFAPEQIVILNLLRTANIGIAINPYGLYTCYFPLLRFTD